MSILTGSDKIQSTFKCFGICLGALISFFFLFLFFAVSFKGLLESNLFKNILLKVGIAPKNCFVFLVGVS